MNKKINTNGTDYHQKEKDKKRKSTVDQFETAIFELEEILKQSKSLRKTKGATQNQ
jgi:hypothetical protein